MAPIGRFSKRQAPKKFKATNRCSQRQPPKSYFRRHNLRKNSSKRQHPLIWDSTNFYPVLHLQKIERYCKGNVNWVWNILPWWVRPILRRVVVKIVVLQVASLPWEKRCHNGSMEKVSKKDVTKPRIGKRTVITIMSNNKYGPHEETCKERINEICHQLHVEWYKWKQGLVSEVTCSNQGHIYQTVHNWQGKILLKTLCRKNALQVGNLQAFLQFFQFFFLTKFSVSQSKKIDIGYDYLTETGARTLTINKWRIVVRCCKMGTRAWIRIRRHWR